MLSRILRWWTPTASSRRAAAPRRGRSSLLLENLEDRLTPAFVISLQDAGATLVVTGDAGDDNILITEGNVQGAVSVSDGSTTQNFTGITNIYVNLNDGTDQSVTFNGLAGAGLAGNFGVSDSSTGTFTLTIADGVEIGGQVAAQENGAAVATINLGVAGGASTTIQDVIIYGGTGETDVVVDDISMGFLSVNLNADDVNFIAIAPNADVTMGYLSVVNLSAGSNSYTDVELGAGANATVQGNIYVVAGLDAFFGMDNATVQGFVTINAPGATSDVFVIIINSDIQAFLSVTTGEGDDFVSLTTFTVGQNLAILTGAGDDSVLFESMTFQGTTNMDLGDDDDFLALDFADDSANTTFAGQAFILMGAGDDAVNYSFDADDAADFLVAGLINGGAGDDTSNDKADSNAVSTTPITQINFENLNNP